MVMREKIQLSGRRGWERAGPRLCFWLGAVLSGVALLTAVQLCFPGVPAKSLADDNAILLPRTELNFFRTWQGNDPQYEADAALKSGLDTLALALGSLVRELPDPEKQKDLLIQALDGIPLRDDYSGYVALWRQTVDIHTPPTPDSAGLDFGFIQDVNGRYFVREMFEKVEQGGGFTDYTLTSWEGGERVVRRAYARPVPGTDYWLMSWRVLDREPVDAVLAANAGSEKNGVSGGMLWTGVCAGGLALAMAYRSSRQRLGRVESV